MPQREMRAGGIRCHQSFFLPTLRHLHFFPLSSRFSSFFCLFHFRARCFYAVVSSLLDAYAPSPLLPASPPPSLSILPRTTLHYLHLRYVSRLPPAVVDRRRSRRRLHHTIAPPRHRQKLPTIYHHYTRQKQRCRSVGTVAGKRSGGTVSSCERRPPGGGRRVIPATVGGNCAVRCLPPGPYHEMALLAATPVHCRCRIAPGTAASSPTFIRNN